MPTLPLTDIVNIAVNFSPVAVIRTGFNLGLILGDSTVISAEDRVKVYANTTEMIADGFAADDPEYIAAQLYFSQSPTPARVAVGRWVSTGESAETAVEALTACRTKNSGWYAFTVAAAEWTEATDTALVAAWAETAVPTAAFFYSVNASGSMTSIFEDLQTEAYKRSIGTYATPVSPATVNYAAAALTGYAMGANYQGAPSYDLAHKSLVGVATEDIDSSELSDILAANGNVYVNQGGTYNLFRQGVMASGVHFDELLGLDMLVNDLQAAVMAALTASPKIPQTEDGIELIKSALDTPLEAARAKAFIAPGVWDAVPVLALNTGDTLSEGYLIQSGAVADQSVEDRAARKAPPIYICIKLAGAIEYVTIALNVNR